MSETTAASTTSRSRSPSNLRASIFTWGRLAGLSSGTASQLRGSACCVAHARRNASVEEDFQYARARWAWLTMKSKGRRRAVALLEHALGWRRWRHYRRPSPWSAMTWHTALASRRAYIISRRCQPWGRLLKPISWRPTLSAPRFPGGYLAPFSGCVSDMVRGAACRCSAMRQPTSLAHARPAKPSVSICRQPTSGKQRWALEGAH